MEQRRSAPGSKKTAGIVTLELLTLTSTPPGLPLTLAAASEQLKRLTNQRVSGNVVERVVCVVLAASGKVAVDTGAFKRVLVMFCGPQPLVLVYCYEKGGSRLGGTGLITVWVTRSMACAGALVSVQVMTSVVCSENAVSNASARLALAASVQLSALRYCPNRVVPLATSWRVYGVLALSTVGEVVPLPLSTTVPLPVVVLLAGLLIAVPSRKICTVNWSPPRTRPLPPSALRMLRVGPLGPLELTVRVAVLQTAL
jgi:hypothetical protein